MTRRQQQIFDFIKRYIAEHGYSPSINDICKGCYTTSYCYIRETLWRLEDQGYIKIEDGKHRSIRVIK